MTEDINSGVKEVQEAVAQQDAVANSGEKSRDSEDFKSLRNVTKEMKADLERKNNEILSLRGEMLSLRESMSKPKSVEDPYDGKDGSDYVTYEDQRKRDEKLIKQMEAEKVSVINQAKVIAFLSSTSDYDDVMKNYGKLLPEDVKDILLEDPYNLKAMKAAYAACKNSAAYYKDTLSNQKEHDNSKRVAENMEKPGSGSSAGSGGTVSMMTKVKNMTRAERIAWSDKCISDGGR